MVEIPSDLRSLTKIILLALKDQASFFPLSWTSGLKQDKK